MHANNGIRHCNKITITFPVHVWLIDVMSVDFSDTEIAFALSVFKRVNTVSSTGPWKQTMNALLKVSTTVISDEIFHRIISCGSMNFISLRLKTCYTMICDMTTMIILYLITFSY